MLDFFLTISEKLSAPCFRKTSEHKYSQPSVLGFWESLIARTYHHLSGQLFKQNEEANDDEKIYPRSPD